MADTRTRKTRPPRANLRPKSGAAILLGMVASLAAAPAFPQGTAAKPGPEAGAQGSASPSAPAGKTGAARAAESRETGPGTAAADWFPYRYVGLGGTGSRPEYVALTDGYTSIVARAGDVLGDRYRIEELRAKELVLTDLVSEKRGIIVRYADIQNRSADAPVQDAPAPVPRPGRPAATASPVERPAPRAPAEMVLPANQGDAGGGSVTESDIRTMISPPPVNRAEQPMPMEVTPPPEHNPMVVTPPAGNVPMITTPSRREHQEAVDIPLGPGK